MENKKVMIVFGTRPEAIKMCPLVLELKNRRNVKVSVCVTGQHREMLQQVLDAFKIEPDINLSIMKKNQDLFDITQSILKGMKDILEKYKPNLVLVHGDTSTTFGVALACFYSKIPVGHVEAGLRTYDIDSPFPEEFNRQAVSIISRMNFAPTEAAKNNLLREGKRNDQIWVTGNTVIDSFKTTVQKDFKHQELEWAQKSRLIMVTAHRRENIGLPMHQMFRAVRKITEEYEDVKILFPIHKNPVIREIAETELGKNNNIHLCEPFDVISCHNIMSKCYLILTDSGGIQEEAPFFGIPVLVMRNTTERVEGVKAGTLKLVGNTEESIYQNCKMLLEQQDLYNKMANAANPYGDGNAAKRISDIIESAL